MLITCDYIFKEIIHLNNINFYNVLFKEMISFVSFLVAIFPNDSNYRTLLTLSGARNCVSKMLNSCQNFRKIRFYLKIRKYNFTVFFSQQSYKNKILFKISCTNFD